MLDWSTHSCSRNNKPSRQCNGWVLAVAIEHSVDFMRTVRYTARAPNRSAHGTRVVNNRDLYCSVSIPMELYTCVGWFDVNGHGHNVGICAQRWRNILKYCRVCRGVPALRLGHS